MFTWILQRLGAAPCGRTVHRRADLREPAAVVVELEALQVDHQHRRKLPEGDRLPRLHVGLACG